MQLQESILQRDELCTTYDHILYIAEQAHAVVVDGALRIESVANYAEVCCSELGVHPNIRGFVARNVAKKVQEWLTHGKRTAH